MYTGSGLGKDLNLSSLHRYQYCIYEKLILKKCFKPLHASDVWLFVVNKKKKKKKT